MRGGGGGPLGVPLRGQRSPASSVATRDDVLRQRQWHRRGSVLIDEEAITGFIKTELDAGAGANIVI